MKNPAARYRTKGFRNEIAGNSALAENRGKLRAASGDATADHLAQHLSSCLLRQARHSIEDCYLPRVVACLRKLSDDDIWWRPNRASNSAGNLVLHLEGNIHQWIGSGLGGKPDIRRRDREFQERGPIPREMLVARLRKEVRAACRVLQSLSAKDLEAIYAIQGFRVSGAQAVSQVVEHFAYHCGQIIYVTKLRLGHDLKFTQLPGDRSRHGKSPHLPAV
jgi:uncharacterized damage-inducible protein DinB